MSTLMPWRNSWLRTLRCRVQGVQGQAPLTGPELRNQLVTTCLRGDFLQTGFDWKKPPNKKEQRKSKK